MTAIIRPEPGTPRAYEFPTATRFTLANGLRVIVAPMPRLPLVSVMAVIDAGASGDAPPAGERDGGDRRGRVG